QAEQRLDQLAPDVMARYRQRLAKGQVADATGRRDVHADAMHPLRAELRAAAAGVPSAPTRAALLAEQRLVDVIATKMYNPDRAETRRGEAIAAAADAEEARRAGMTRDERAVEDLTRRLAPLAEMGTGQALQMWDYARKLPPDTARPHLQQIESRLDQLAPDVVDRYRQRLAAAPGPDADSPLRDQHGEAMHPLRAELRAAAAVRPAEPARAVKRDAAATAAALAAADTAADTAAAHQGRANAESLAATTAAATSDDPRTVRV
ncbi:hypothetical protein, partial [Motilibacter deserti]